jgi:DNA replication protein DnaC
MRGFSLVSDFSRPLAKVDLIVLDDFALTPLSDANRRDLLEILDDRYDRKSTLITSQLPVKQWHAYLGDPRQTPEQMEISRLRAELARANMQVAILKKATAYFAKDAL